MKLIDTFFPEHFSRADRRGILMGTLLTLLAFIFFYKTPAPTRSAVERPIAHIESFSNNVRFKDSGSASFYKVQSGEDFQNRDEIFTGEKSNAVIRFLNSKTILKMPSSSLIKIEDGEHGEEIEIKEGGVDLVIQKDQIISLNSNGTTHKISSSKKESSIKIFYSTGELRLFTKDKGVKLKNSNGESELAYNQNSVIKPISSPSGSKNAATASTKKTLPNDAAKKEINITHDNRSSSEKFSESDVEEALPLNDKKLARLEENELTQNMKIGLSILLTLFFVLACF